MEWGHSRSQVALFPFCWRVVMRRKSNNTDWAIQRNCPTEHQPGTWVSPQAAAQRRRPQALAPTRGTALSFHDLAGGSSVSGMVVRGSMNVATTARTLLAAGEERKLQGPLSFD